MRRMILFCVLLLVPLAAAMPSFDDVSGALLTGQAVEVVDGRLWVPWYTGSRSCLIADLHKGQSCDIGIVNRERNCMVTDEFSQVAILVAMGDDESLMEALVETLSAIRSRNGVLPSWRVVRGGSSIVACDPRVNGNCDTASDADARIAIALATAGMNPAFGDRARYTALADAYVADMVAYEIVHECHPSPYGEICSWLAAGSEAARGGLASTDFGYAGYYPDALLALLYACPSNGTYCDVARDLAHNYLLAARYDGDLSVPPGRSFRWTNLSGTPSADCTNTCAPVQWDSADAPRALAICATLPAFDALSVDVPELHAYCALLAEEMQDPRAAPIQFYPDGTAERPRSDVFAQGLQAMLLWGTDRQLSERALAHALSHYSPETGTMDYDACFGVYNSAYALRALARHEGKAHAERLLDGQEILDEPSFAPVRQLSCAIPGLTPWLVTWSFGDGSYAVTTSTETTHAFLPGAYAVRCVARGYGSTWMATLPVDVK